VAAVGDDGRRSFLGRVDLRTSFDLVAARKDIDVIEMS